MVQFVPGIALSRRRWLLARDTALDYRMAANPATLGTGLIRATEGTA